MAGAPSAGLTRKQKAEQTRQRILEVAIDRFARQQYDEVSVAELAESAGVAYGLLFHHFDNKRTLYLEVLREVARQLSFHHTAASAEERHLRPGDQLRRMFVRHLTWMAEHPDLARSIISGGIGADPEASEIFDADRRSVARWWLGMVDLDADNEALALAVQTTVVAVDTATVEWIRGGCRFAIEDMAEVMVDLMVNAMRSAQRLDPTLDVTKAVRLVKPKRKASAR